MPAPVLFTVTAPLVLSVISGVSVLSAVLLPVSVNVRVWPAVPQRMGSVFAKVIAPVPEASSVAAWPAAVPLMVKTRSVLPVAPV